MVTVVKNLLMKIATTTKVTLVSEKYEKIDGYYFDVKIAGILEHVSVLARDLLNKHTYYLELDDLELVIETLKQEKRYNLIYMSDKEFMVLDRYTGQMECLDLEYGSLQKFPENSFKIHDIIKISNMIEQKTIDKNGKNIKNYLMYTKRTNARSFLRLV